VEDYGKISKVISNKQQCMILLLLSESLSGKYANLHPVAASNNRDHAL